MWLRRAAVALAAAGLAAGTAGCRSRQTLTVAAAVSLAEALDEAAAAWRQAGGEEVAFNLAGSNALARQIVQGAPADVFVSADARQMDRVERAAALEPGTRTPIAGNALVIVVPGAGQGRWSDATPLAGAGRIAIGDPDAVPAGVYAKAWLERVGLWNDVRERIVPTANVRAALAAVDAGAVGAAIVYRTDARVRGRRSVVYDVPEKEGPPIVYYAAVVKGSAHAGSARAFVAFLAGETGAAILARHGFARAR